MKKILFGTTALVAAGMFVGAASAAEAMKISVTGYQSLWLIYGSQSDNAGEPAENLRNHGIFKEGEIHFTASTTMDNGIKIGFKTELEAEADNMDGNFIWLQGDVGRVVIGGDWGPTLMMNSGMPGAAPGWGDFANHAPATAPANSQVGGPNTLAALAGKSNKIVYYTPRMGPGLQIGIAYTPEAGDGPASRGGFTTDNETSDFGTTVEVAVSLISKVGKGSLNTYATYIKSSRETSETGEQDRTAWGIGATYSAGAWSIGARYKTDDEGVIADSDEKAYGLGASYSVGKTKYALNYVKGEDENGGGTAADDMTFLQLSMAYTWGPGVTLAAGIQNTKFEDGGSVAADENNATVVFMGTSLSF